MHNEQKLIVIRAYLTGKFPGYALEDKYNVQCTARKFLLTGKEKSPLIVIENSFFDQHSAVDALQKLIDYRLDQYINNKKTVRINITDAGITLCE